MRRNASRLRLLISLITIITVLASVSLSAFAESGDQAPPATDDQTQQTVVASDGQTSQTPAATDDQTAQAQSGNTVQEPVRELTAAEKEALAIKKYGYYKGKNATKIPVITYHRIVSDKEKKKRKNSSTLIISRSKLNKEMKWLHDRHYRTINCEEFYLWYKGKIKLPPKSVLITFDDGNKEVLTYALPILKKYKMKATSFVIGRPAVNGKKTSISYKQIKSLSKSQDLLEFQSHTYALHSQPVSKFTYAKIKKDSLTQKKYFGFEYLAYPYGTNNKRMRQAYKDTGIKLAFTYGSNGYATRKQNIYQIRRIKISGNASLSQFKRWFR